LLAPPSAPKAHGEQCESVHTAQVHLLGVVWNMAVAKCGALRVALATRLLGHLFALVRFAAESPDRVEDVWRYRLLMALVHLSKDVAVAAMPECLGAVEALVALVDSGEAKDPDAAYHLLANLVEAHGFPAAVKVSTFLWGRITAQDVAEQAHAPALFTLFVRTSAVNNNASAWLSHLDDVGQGLAGTFRRLSLSSAPGARNALVCLAGVLWNLAMDKSPEWCEMLGQALLPVILDEELWPFKDGDKVVLAYRIATFLLHLSSAPANHELLSVAMWRALEAGELPDDSCAQMLQVLRNVLHELWRQHGCCGAPAIECGERALRVFRGQRWTVRLSWDGMWPQSVAAEMSVLVQVCSLCDSVKESLASSGLLHHGGLVHEALQPRPDGRAPDAGWEREARSKALAVMVGLAGSRDGALLAWLAGLLLKKLLATPADALEEFGQGECESLVLALHLCAESSVEADLWGRAYRPVVKLAERVAKSSTDQAVARGLRLLGVAFARRGWERALPLAGRILEKGCSPEVRMEALDLFAQAPF